MSFSINSNTRTTFEDPFKIQREDSSQLSADVLEIIIDFYYIPLSGIHGEDLGVADDPYLEKNFKRTWKVKELIRHSTLNQFKVMYALVKSNGSLHKPLLQAKLQIIALDQGQYKYFPSPSSENSPEEATVNKKVELKVVHLDPSQKTSYISTFIAAVRRVETATIDILCSYIKHFENRQSILNYALWEACYHKKISDDIPRILIKSGANVSLADNESVLMQAIRSQNFDTAKALISLKANVNFQAKADKQTALHLACSYAPALIEKLLEAGADANLQDIALRTPLHILHHERRWSDIGKTKEIADAKLREKTNFALEDAAGNTPYTEMYGHTLSAQAAMTGSTSSQTPREQKQSGLFGGWF